MAGVTWFAMIVVGVILMWMMRWTNGKSAKFIDGWLLRGAALAFIGAGMIGASGWIGNLFDATLGNLIGALNGVGSLAVGTGLAWALGLGMAIAWIMAFVPESVSKFNYPDWLVLAGLILPPFLQLIPGGIGSGLRDLFQMGGNAAMTAVAAMVA